MQYKVITGIFEGHCFSGVPSPDGSRIVDLETTGRSYPADHCRLSAPDMLDVPETTGASEKCAEKAREEAILKLYSDGKLTLKKTEKTDFEPGTLFFIDHQKRLF